MEYILAGLQEGLKMSEQKMTYIMLWNGFQSTGPKSWTNGLYTMAFKKGYYFLFGNGNFCDAKNSCDLVDFMIKHNICVPCPVTSDSRDSYFLLNGFSLIGESWERNYGDKRISVSIDKRRSNEYLFDTKTYTWALLKKKLREYGFLEVKEILPKGRISV